MKSSRRAVHLTTTVALVLALATTVVACGSNSSSSSNSSSAAHSSGSAQLAPMRLGIATWIGFAPLVLAAKEGYYQKEGLNLTYNVIDNGEQRFSALKAGKIDGVAATMDSFARINALGIPSVQVLGFDHSVGADGILVKSSTTDVSRLKGQTIGVPEGTVSQFFLAKVLQDHGLSLHDVHEINMTAGDAGTAYLAGRVPNVVTYEPYLTKARQKPGGKVLVTSAQYPDTIVDTLAIAPTYVKNHRASVEAFMRAYFKALHDLETNPSKSYPLLEDYLGLNPSQMAAAFKTVKLYSQAENKTFMTRSLPKVYADAAKFWKQIGVIKKLPDTKTAIDASVLLGLGS